MHTVTHTKKQGKIFHCALKAQGGGGNNYVQNTNGAQCLFMYVLDRFFVWRKSFRNSCGKIAIWYIFNQPKNPWLVLTIMAIKNMISHVLFPFMIPYTTIYVPIYLFFFSTKWYISTHANVDFKSKNHWRYDWKQQECA